MIRTVRTRYSGGKLEPLEPLDLEEGREVEVSFEDAPAAERERERATPSEDGPPPEGGLARIVKKVKELQETIPPEAWDVLPTDGAQNYKHYLYGHPKEDER